LGFGDTVDRLYPVNLKFSNTQKACYVSCGEEFTCILTKDGGVFTFGAGEADLFSFSFFFIDCH
jgi:E3 ubiquitin-protein ligase HERC4